jgi:hypothetical protein
MIWSCSIFKVLSAPFYKRLKVGIALEKLNNKPRKGVHLIPNQVYLHEISNNLGFTCSNRIQ